MRRTGVMVSILGGLVAAAAAAEQPAGPAIILTDRLAHAIPARRGCTFVGAGTFNVRQPSPDAVVVTMLGAVVATGHPQGSSAVMELNFDQGFEISAGPARGRTQLSLETQVCGVLRGGRIAAGSCGAGATVAAGGVAIVSADLPDRAVACGDNLAVNDRAAPDDVDVKPGIYALHAHWRLAATHPAGLRGKAASAEFAPEPALDPIWVGGPRDPFHGVDKRDFGLRITLHVTAPPAAESGSR